jgi:WD40 repeat protein
MLQCSFEGHEAEVTSIAFSPDGARIVSGSLDTTTRIWDVESGRELASMIASWGEWLTITPAGFFDASDGGHHMVSLVRGTEVISIEPFRGRLRRKDLVRAALSRDEFHRYEDRASKLDLQQII